MFQGPQHVPALPYHSRKDEEEKTFQYVQLAINMLPMHIQMSGGPQVARWPAFSSSDFGPFLPNQYLVAQIRELFQEP